MLQDNSANHKPLEAMATEAPVHQSSAVTAIDQVMAKSTNTTIDSPSKSNDSTSGSSNDELREQARRRKKAKLARKLARRLERKQQDNLPKRTPVTVYTPQRRDDTLWGKGIIRNKLEAIEFAGAVHERASLAHLVFWTDGSLREREAGGAGVVWTSQPGNEHAWHDHGYGVKGFARPNSLELVGIGAALRLAAGMMTGSIMPDRSPSPGSSSSSQSESDSSLFMSTTMTRKVTILTDSRASVKLLGGNTISHDEAENEVLRTVMAWSQRLVSLQPDVEIEIHWVPGHDTRTPCNKRADQMAKAASELVRDGLAQKNRDGTVEVVDVSFLQCP